SIDGVPCGGWEVTMTGADHQHEPTQPADAGAGLPGDGLAWSWELDLEALVAAVSDPAPWSRDPSVPPGQHATVADTDADLAEYLGRRWRRAGRGWCR